MGRYFAIGIEHGKTEHNIGTLWRSAQIFGASYIFTIGRRYKRQSSDTLKTWANIPLFHYDNVDELYDNLPYDCQLVGIEILPGTIPLRNFVHPKRVCYLLGAEDHGLTKEAIEKCHHLIQLPGKFCLNVAVAGSIVMYDRWQKLEDKQVLGEEK